MKCVEDFPFEEENEPLREAADVFGVEPDGPSFMVQVLSIEVGEDLTVSQHQHALTQLP